MIGWLLCLVGRPHRGSLGVNPENNNTEVHCRRCGTWTPARSFVMKKDESIEYHG